MTKDNASVVKSRRQKIFEMQNDLYFWPSSTSVNPFVRIRCQYLCVLNTLSVSISVRFQRYFQYWTEHHLKPGRNFAALNDEKEKAPIKFLGNW